MKNWRDDFPIFSHQPDLIYLDTAATAHKPRVVIEEIGSFYAKDNATVHRAVYRSSLTASERYLETRQTVAQFLNAQVSDEIIFTRGTTDAINLIALSYGKTFLKEGDEIVLSEVEHHSNLVSWQMLAQEKKLILRYMKIDQEGNLLWENVISEKTKIVSLAHISNVTGTIHPIQEIAIDAHKKGAILIVDGAQAAPYMPVDVQALNCDFYAFSGHKCYGPKGIGILYGKRAHLERMPPVQGGGDMIVEVSLDGSTFAPPIRSWHADHRACHCS